MVALLPLGSAMIAPARADTVRVTVSTMRLSRGGAELDWQAVSNAASTTDHPNCRKQDLFIDRPAPILPARISRSTIVGARGLEPPASCFQIVRTTIAGDTKGFEGRSRGVVSARDTWHSRSGHAKFALAIEQATDVRRHHLLIIGDGFPFDMTPHVLIADGDQAMAENIAAIVQTLGAHTTIVADRQNALARAAKTRFDVALIDVRLPDGDGISLFEPLRALAPSTQMVLLCNNASLEGAMAALRVGALAYVQKPFSSSDLLAIVRRACAQAARYREAESLRLELELSERRWELVGSMPSFALALDEMGRITTWNRQLEQVTGLSREEMLGTPGAALVGYGEAPQALPVKGGGERQVRWRHAEVQERGGEPMVYAVGIDVTDEQEMLRRTARAERLAAVGTMAAGLAHEVRNPLNSASLQLTLLARSLSDGEGPESTLPITLIIKSEIERLEKLVRDFLAFAQPRPIERRPLDLRKLLAAVVTLIRPEIDAANVRVDQELDPSLPSVIGDPARLQQVFLNLTRNASEAMHAKGGGVLTIRTRRVEAAVEIDVEDDGPGFAEDLPVFDAFFTTKPHGTGLGLSLVHRIVTDHGGAIRVQSEAGCTCFTLTLPCA
ncbi:MAG TPA: ATP-binding protein [Polyangia bacterium]|jgi:nitrogen-specific signal transduction histidine kinase/CheY-like chemotaxis protein